MTKETEIILFRLSTILMELRRSLDGFSHVVETQRRNVISAELELGKLIKRFESGK